MTGTLFGKEIPLCMWEAAFGGEALRMTPREQVKAAVGWLIPA